MAVELAEIFRQCGLAYRQKYVDRIPTNHLQAMRAIETCRTAALGGQVFVCPDCREVQYSYHPCRNRHCPKCQCEKGQAWLEQQQAMLLPVPYFLLTFTLPAGLREVARHHQRVVYDLLFRLSAEATSQLAKDPQFVGGQIGLVGVLHTWGRNLSYHPHIHYLVPAGGLARDGQRWLGTRYEFLVPVKALSKIFRAKMHQALQKEGEGWSIPAEVWQRDWVVHCKPVGCGRQALKYLAPYYRPDFAHIQVPVLSFFAMQDGSDYLSSDFMNQEQQVQVLDFFKLLVLPFQKKYIEQFRHKVPHANFVEIPHGHHYCFIKQEEIVFTDIIQPPYSYCRNPMVLGMIVFYTGMAVAFGSIGSMLLVLIATGLLLLYVRQVEEQVMVLRFGQAYLDYKQRTPFLTPKLRK